MVKKDIKRMQRRLGAQSNEGVNNGLGVTRGLSGEPISLEFVTEENNIGHSGMHQLERGEEQSREKARKKDGLVT